jgi:hypothetical protein
MRPSHAAELRAMASRLGAVSCRAAALLFAQQRRFQELSTGLSPSQIRSTAL